MSHTRRHFLKHVGLGALGTFLTPYERFAEGFANAFVQRAYAQEANMLATRYYLNVFFGGGPHRVVFDHWFRTNANDPALISNMTTNTAFTKSGTRMAGYEYRTFTAANGLLVPHLFSQTVNTSSGQKNLSSLLNHMLAIRGFSSGIDGHALNLAMQQNPLSGAPSMLALAGDVSNAPYPAVRYRSNGPFVSMAGKSVSVLDNDNPLKNMFVSLQPSTQDLQKVRSIKERNIAAYERAEAQLKLLSESNTLGAKTLKSNMENAKAILKRGLGDIDAYWGPAVTRYRNAINTSIRTANIAGISDAEVSPFGNTGWRIESDKTVAGDMRGSLNDASIDGYAESLAVAEYLITENYAASIQISAPGLGNMRVNTTNGVQSYVDHDHHFLGTGPSTFIMNAYFRGVLAGILELKEKLEQKSLGAAGNAWNQTVVHFSGDFGRVGNRDGNGSEHGWQYNVNSVITGAFSNGPFCVGNIYTGTNNNGGTLGLAAPITNYAIAGVPSLPFAASHVAHLLGLQKNPFENVAPPAVKLTGNSLVANFPGKLIAGG